MEQQHAEQQRASGMQRSHANQAYQAWAINVLLKARARAAAGTSVPTMERFYASKLPMLVELMKNLHFFRGVMFQVG